MRTTFKALFGGASVAAVVGGIALSGGTSAFFYDVESSAGNSTGACDFDLTYTVDEVVRLGTATPTQSTSTVTGAGVQNGTNGSFALAGLQPGDRYRATLLVANAGSCAGDLYMDVDNAVDAENGLTEPEAAAGDTTADDGELGDVVRLTFREVGGGLSTTGSLAQFTATNAFLIGGEFGGGDTKELEFTFAVPNRGAGAENAIMTDSYAFDLDFAIIQDGQAVPSTL